MKKLIVLVSLVVAAVVVGGATMMRNSVEEAKADTPILGEPITSGLRTRTWGAHPLTSQEVLYYNGAVIGENFWAQGLAAPFIQIIYGVRARNVETGTLLSSGTTVNLEDRIRFEFVPYHYQQIAWTGTGYSVDTPYGEWIEDAVSPPLAGTVPVTEVWPDTVWPGDYQLGTCEDKDIVTQTIGTNLGVYIPLVVHPPQKEVNVQGMECDTPDANGNVECVVTQTSGSVNAALTFGDTFGHFYYRYLGRHDRCYGTDAPMRYANLNEVDRMHVFGNPGDTPISGDWNGDGKNQIGVWRAGRFYFDITGDGTWNPDGGDYSTAFGNPTDTPIIGDWNGDDRDQIGVWRAGKFYLDMDGDGNWDPSVDVSYPFGNVGDTPIIGDWNGDRRDQIGVWRAGKFYLDMDGDGNWDPSVDVEYTFGGSNRVPIIGDWNGDGTDQIGVYNPSNRWFSFDMDGDGNWDPSVDVSYPFGNVGDTPIIGDWNGDDRDQIGVHRGGRFLLDYNGDMDWTIPEDTYTLNVPNQQFNYAFQVREPEVDPLPPAAPRIQSNPLGIHSTYGEERIDFTIQTTHPQDRKVWYQIDWYCDEAGPYTPIGNQNNTFSPEQPRNFHRTWPSMGSTTDRTFCGRAIDDGGQMSGWSEYQFTVEPSPVDELKVTCSASPNPAYLPNARVVFTPNVLGGIQGDRQYRWEGACTGNDEHCERTFTGGDRPVTATVTVTSGDQEKSVSCSTHIRHRPTNRLEVLTMVDGEPYRRAGAQIRVDGDVVDTPYLLSSEDPIDVTIEVVDESFEGAVFEKWVTIWLGHTIRTFDICEETGSSCNVEVTGNRLYRVGLYYVTSPDPALPPRSTPRYEERP